MSQRGAGAQPRLSGQRVTVKLSLSAHGAHRLQAQDLAIANTHISRELQRGQSGRVVHLDFEAGERVQQGGGGHGDFVRAVIDALRQGEERSTESTGCRCQIRRSRGVERIICKHRGKNGAFRTRNDTGGAESAQSGANKMD